MIFSIIYIFIFCVFIIELRKGFFLAPDSGQDNSFYQLEGRELGCEVRLYFLKIV